MEETSLSDFVAESDDGEGDAAGDRGEAGDQDQRVAPADGADAHEGPAVADADESESDGDSADEPPEPAITAAYSPGGETCEACGATVGWRWVEGERHVCAACKDW